MSKEAKIVTVHIAEIDEAACWHALEAALGAWIRVSPADLSCARYHNYCEAKAAWHGASARLFRARGREHIKRIT